MSSGQGRRRRIVEMLADEGVNATPDAVAALEDRDDVSAAVSRAVATSDDRLVLTAEDIHGLDVEGGDGSDGLDQEPRGESGASGGDAAAAVVETAETEPAAEASTSTKVDAKSTPSPSAGAAASDDRADDEDAADDGPPSPQPFEDRSFEVSGDITGESTCTGDLDDFVRYFRDRFERLERVLRGRVNPRRIDSLQGGRSTAVVGMVKDVRATRSDNRLVELEDPSGSVNVVLSDEDVEKADRLVVDEVVAVEGRVSGDGEVVYVDDVYFPDVPRGRKPETADREVEAVLVSDVHVGSDTFREDLWHEFTDWLSSREDVEYLLVGGDLVEGVGIYPGQEDELDVVDLRRQYELCGELFHEIPGDVEVVAISGNHDSVRLAEPQPAPAAEFREPFPSNVSFVGNPSAVTVEGVSVLMYHGVSLNPFAELLPDVEIESPETAMVEMLRKRHLAPMYGRVRLAPEEHDQMVIDEVPDVLHTGHTHTVGADRYKGVNVVNSGAWQSQTSYQRKMNIQPDVGYAAVLDLSTLDMEFKRFDG